MDGSYSCFFSVVYNNYVFIYIYKDKSKQRWPPQFAKILYLVLTTENETTVLISH